MNHVLAAIALSLHSVSRAAMPAECNMAQFPAHWADAQSRVVWLTSFLEGTEQRHGFASATTQPFRQVLGMCKAKREAASETRGSATTGVVSQLKCEALLVCARIEAIEMED
ncbi:MAG TPA: hypothetical protein VLW55_00175 [Burkholderiaceae bacterium]|nr:hypothetical protein [Burkholderiaceae bacterium]